MIEKRTVVEKRFQVMACDEREAWYVGPAHDTESAAEWYAAGLASNRRYTIVKITTTREVVSAVYRGKVKR